MIPGWGTGAPTWNHARAFLGKDAAVRTVGWHEAGDGEGSTGRIGEILASRPERWVVAGWSLGSLLALSAALAHPDRIAHLVLVSATARFCADGAYPGADPRALRAMRHRLHADREGVLSAFADLCIAPEGDIVPRGRFLAQARRRPVSRLALGLDLLARIDLRRRAGALSVPVTMFHGEEDRVVPVESAWHLHDLLPGSRLRVYPGRGHALPWSVADLIGLEIGELLR
jgi:pimeloyl-[acyl-carrier protein] methyl ester esterase